MLITLAWLDGFVGSAIILTASSVLRLCQMAEMEERRKAMIDQILTPEARERLARIGE